MKAIEGFFETSGYTSLASYAPAASVAYDAICPIICVDRYYQRGIMSICVGVFVIEKEVVSLLLSCCYL